MHAGILFIPLAIFWDDWVLVDTPNEIILETFKQLGSMFNLYGRLHEALLSTGVWTYKILTFVFMGATGYFLNEILKRNGAFSVQVRQCTVLLFLLLPFNFARVAIIDFPYIACYFLFFAAWLAMDRHRILAAVLFFLSFNTNSLLVFYALPVIDLIYRSSDRRTINTIARFALTRWELFVIPFLYFGIKVLFFKPSGFYSGYNQGYNLLAVPHAVLAQAKDILTLRVSAITTFLFIPFVYCALIKIFKPGEDQVENKNEKQLFSNSAVMAVGGIAILLGGFPYWILGHVPTFLEWTSRHQLLMPLGAALIFSSAIMYANGIRIALLAIVVSACLSYGVEGYFKFYNDWQKQLFLIEKFKHDPAISKANFVILEDRTKELNAIERSYRGYEINGMLMRAVGDERRFSAEPENVIQYAKGDFDKYFHPQYKAGQHVRSADEPVALVEIDFKNPDGQGLFSSLAPEILYKSRILSREEWAKMSANAKSQSE